MRKNNKFSHEVGSIDEALTGVKINQINKKDSSNKNKKSSFVSDLWQA